MPPYPSPAPVRPPSLPLYQPHALGDDLASHYLVVWADAPDDSDRAFVADLAARAPGRHSLLKASENGADAAARLVSALEAALHQAHAGTRLYLSGPEALLWPLYDVAYRAGMQPQEISLHLHDDARRPVFCVHCGVTQLVDAAQERPVCAHCNAVLEVRSHFSRLHGAYLGVAADADAPYAPDATAARS